MAWKRKKVESNQAKCVGFKKLRLSGGSQVLFLIFIMESSIATASSSTALHSNLKQKRRISIYHSRSCRYFVISLISSKAWLQYNIILKNISFLHDSSIFRPHSNSPSVSQISYELPRVFFVEIHYEITKCVERHVTTQRWQWIIKPMRGKLCVSHEKSHHFDDCRTLYTAQLSNRHFFRCQSATTTIFRVSLHVASLMKLCNAISLMDYSL